MAIDRVELICETVIGRHAVSVVRWHGRVHVAICGADTFTSPDEAESFGHAVIAAAERARAVEAQLRALDAAGKPESTK